MSKELSGRQPLQIVELVQPLCVNTYGKGRCAGGSGLNSPQTLERWSGDSAEGWTTTSATFTPYPTTGGGVFQASAMPARFTSPTFPRTFSGTTYRYIVVRGQTLGAFGSITWKAAYGAYSAGETVTAVNQSDLQGLAAGEDFVAVFDMSQSADYATKWEGQSLDHYRIEFGGSPTSFNVVLYSITAATENPLDNIGRECYNTRGSCDDPLGYQQAPEALLTTSFTAEQGEIIANALFVGDEDFVLGVDVVFPETAAAGVIAEFGGPVTGTYLGVTSGNLICRAGDGSAGATTTNGYISTDVTPYLGRAVSFLMAIRVGDSTVSLWSWDELERTLTLIGSDAATAGFPSGEWSGAGAGGCGIKGNTIVAVEDDSDWNGLITGFRAYNSTPAPITDKPFAVNLFFGHGDVAERKIPNLPYIIPALGAVSNVPTKLNLGTTSDDAQGLGQRALASFTFADFPHTDKLVDPYLATRLVNPFGRSTFWPKWLARNKYRYNMLMRSYEGYAGEALSAMTQRSFLLQSTSGPDERGQVTFQGRDPLGLLESKRAQLPQTSPGELQFAINATETTVAVVGATADDYDASGTLRINDELMTYSSYTQVNNALQFAITARGTDNTVAAEHAVEDTVQRCIRFETQQLNSLIRTLLITHAGFPYYYLDHNGLDTQVNNFLPLFQMQTVLSEPVALSRLISEIQEQSGLNIWWDERARLVRFKAIRGVTATPPLLTDSAHILADSFSVRDEPRNRVSQVWYYYDLKSPVRDVDSPASYNFSVVRANLASESDVQNGSPSIKKIFSRWVNTSPFVSSLARQLVNRYSDAPLTATFAIDAKDSDLWVGDVIRLSHYLLVDEDGERKIENWTITAAEVVEYGDVIRFTAENTASYGQLALIQAAPASDYTPGADKFLAWVGDENGLLSDGTESSRIG